MRSYLAAALIGYLFGTPNPSLMLSRVRGVDVTEGGSGNPGATNTMVVMGLRFGLLVAFFDISKAILAVRLCRRLFRTAQFAGAVGGVACVLGHVFPFYRHFRGGKGFAAYVGMILALDWRYVAYFIVPVILVILVTDYFVSGTMATLASFPFYCAAVQLRVTAVLALVASAIVLCKHHDNMIAIANGTERHVRRRHSSDSA